MSKHQYLLWGRRDQTPEAFSRWSLDELAPALLDIGDFSLKLTTTDTKPPRFAVIPFQQQPLSLFSLEGDGLPDTADIEELLGRHGEELAGYKVAESIPRGYRRSWPDGEPTPGVGLLTLFKRLRGLDDRKFFARWHDVHTPLTLRIHPVWCYVRNVVERSLTPDAPVFDGIVEEHFREPRDLLSARHFFGGPFRMFPNMLRVGFDIFGFIDLLTIQTYLVSEFHLRSKGDNQ